TTTIGIFILYLYSFIRGRNNINIFNRRISREDIQKAIVVVSLSTLLCISAVFILSATEDAPLLSLVFEVASAFGTTGLSLGITDSLSTVGKIVIMVLMFIGRIGMLYTLMFFIRKRDRDLSYKMPTEKIIIG
ncbi:MAG: TrkH family potassium uptake protein, partial [Ligilactobacillus sp.]|nr:TrkH family potassium uptake protein [Ligilactobacillus sp.]